MPKHKKSLKKKSPKHKIKKIKKNAPRALTPQLKEKIQQLLKRLELI